MSVHGQALSHLDRLRPLLRFDLETRQFDLGIQLTSDNGAINARRSIRASRTAPARQPLPHQQRPRRRQRRLRLRPPPARAGADHRDLDRHRRALPRGTHNARPFRGGVLFNDTDSDTVVWCAGRDASPACPALSTRRSSHRCRRHRHRPPGVRAGPLPALRHADRRGLIAHDGLDLRSRRRPASTPSTSPWTCATPPMALPCGRSESPVRPSTASQTRCARRAAYIRRRGIAGSSPRLPAASAGSAGLRPASP